MSTDTKSLMDMAVEERSDLAAFLQTLTPEEWDAASLCDNWTVKDVVAHVVSYLDGPDHAQDPTDSDYAPPSSG